MDFGMPTLIELQNIEECIVLCQELKLQFIEINMNMPQYQVDVLDIEALKIASEKGIYFTFHLDENFNIADFNKKVSQAYMETIKSTIKIAKQLNSPIINMHMSEGIHFKLPDKKVYLFDQYNDFYMKSLAVFRNECEKHMAGSEIKICIENCDGYLPFMKNGIDFLLEKNIFQLTFDIGHDYCAKNMDEPFIYKNKSRVKHMHIHDAYEDKCHLILGTGKLDIKDRMSIAYSENCRCVIETKTVLGLRESVRYLYGLGDLKSN